MAIATPLDLVAEQDAAPLLSPDDAAFLCSFVALCDEEEARDPGGVEREIAASEVYGSDFARELADIQAGRHPLQEPVTMKPPG
jgi:hypothetical protein